MMDSLDFRQKSDTVKVEVDPSEAGKAFGNISGKRGKIKKSINPRDWFGVSSKDLDEIKREFANDIRRIKDDSRSSDSDNLALLAVESVVSESPRDLFDSIFEDLIRVNDGDTN